ncbi:hypothetical protein [Burkholderia perseverans]|uniref:hypothetical protein n=1 Tax=Burkholderia perseverans TaxID=2615214 RepID=UPI001FEF3C71|nr:hypothetical protein [Burkholderia perseverans]
MSLDVILAEDAPRDALNAIVAAHPAGETFVKPLLRYVGLFAPAKSQMSHSRIAALVNEIAPMIRTAQIERSGRVWPAPLDYWMRGFEQMLALRDLGRLNLPLKSHGYLLEVIAGFTEKAEARRETHTEHQRQGHAGLGTPAARASPPPLALPISTPAAPAEVPREITPSIADSLATIRTITKQRTYFAKAGNSDE